MEMRRRTLLGLLAGAGVALATPLLPLLERLLPKRVTTAIRGHRYPGPTRPLDPAEVSRPGHWMG
jgi:hypothetical protein